MKKGDILKYSRSVNAGEARLPFIRLHELEEGRVEIQLIFDYRINPIETVEEAEVRLADPS